MTTTTTQSRLAHVLAAARRGWPVFPLRGKSPAIPAEDGGHGFYDATLDTTTVETWAAKWNPTGWGIRTGAESGILVLDADAPGNGKPDGFATLRALVAEHGDLPLTYTVRSGRGGLHYYFRHPGGHVASRNGALGGGLDVKADGGYIVAAGSVHPDTGRTYEVVADEPLADLPDWILDILKQPEQRPSLTVVGAVIPNGKRSMELTSMAGVMRRRGLSPEAITAALLQENRQRCNPPLQDSEVESIAKSVGRYMPGEREYSRNDLGNAQRMVALHGDSIRYCPQLGGYVVWDGRRWKCDSLGEVWRMALDVAATIRMDADALPEGDSRRKDLGTWSFQSERRHVIEATLIQAQAQPGIAVEHTVFDVDPWALNVGNGILDLRTGLLSPHDPAAMHSKLAPVDFIKDADCPTWHTFLNGIMAGNRGLIRYLQYAVGYSLTGDVRERAIFIPHGSGKNGKSVFLQTIFDMLGDYSTKIPIRALMENKPQAASPELVRLRGARFAWAAENKSSDRMNSALLKEWTGRESVTCRDMYSTPMTFKPGCHFWIGTNHFPRVDDDTDGVWDRLKPVPYNVRFANSQELKEHPDATPEDKNMPDKVRTELPGILTWALIGCLGWQRDGLTDAPEIRAATRGFRADNDPWAGFAETLDFTGPTAVTPTAELWAAYQTWADGAGIRNRLTQKALASRLTERKAERVRETVNGHQTRVWRRVSLT